MKNLSHRAHLIPLHLRERPDDGDPARLAHWYIGGQAHWPCPPGSGCPECWSTLTGILEGATAMPDGGCADPVEQTALDLLELWYRQGSTFIEVRFGPRVPAFDPSFVPGVQA